MICAKCKGAHGCICGQMPADDAHQYYTVVYANQGTTALCTKHFADQSELARFVDEYKAQVCQPLVFLGKISPAGYTVEVRPAMKWKGDRWPR